MVVFRCVPIIHNNQKNIIKLQTQFLKKQTGFNNMFVFQVIGAFWYFFSIQRETACWHLVCGNLSGCGNSFSCANTDSSVNYAFLDDRCPINTPNTTKFNFGIFLEALQSGIVQSSNLPQKFFYCFWWGLRNLRFACITLLFNFSISLY